MLSAGQLNRPIVIESPSTTKDAFGQPSTTGWTALLSTWASIRAVTSKEVYALGAGFTSQVTHKVTLRYPTVTITPAMRVIYRGRTFVVQAVQDPDEERVQLDLLCLEETP